MAGSAGITTAPLGKYFKMRDSCYSYTPSLLLTQRTQIPFFLFYTSLSTSTECCRQTLRYQGNVELVLYIDIEQ